MEGFKPSNVTSDLLINNQNFAKDIKRFDMELNSTPQQAFVEGATTFGANISTGLALGADALSEAIGTDKSENTMFRSMAKSLLDMRKDNGYVSGYDQIKTKKLLMDGDILGAMQEIGFKGTIEEFAKSAPYMLGYSIPYVGLVGGTAAAGVSYAVENAQLKKELAGDKTPLTVDDVYNTENVINASAQAILDRVGFGAEKSAFKAMSNISARKLLTADPIKGLKTIGDMTRQTVKGTLGEGITEMGQQYLQESYGREDYLSPINSKEARENIAFAGLVGGMVGGHISQAGQLAPAISSDIKSIVDDGRRANKINKEAKDVYESMPEDIKASTPLKSFQEAYKQEADAELRRENASIQVDESGAMSVSGVIDDNLAVYNPVDDTVEVVKEDGTKEAVAVEPEQKEQLKKDAVYQTIKDSTNEDIIAQQDMWKALGFDTDVDTEVSGVIGSKMAENESRTNLESIIVSADEKLSKIINDSLMLEIASANKTKLEAMLSRKSMFGLEPEARLNRIASKWQVNNMTEEGRAEVLGFMQAEKDYAIKRLEFMKSVEPSKITAIKVATPVASTVAASQKPTAVSTPKAKPSTVAYDIKSTQTLSTVEPKEITLDSVVQKHKHIEKSVNEITKAVSSINTMFSFKYNPKYSDELTDELVQTNPIGLFAEGLSKDGDKRTFVFSKDLVEKTGIVGLLSVVAQSSIGSTDESKTFAENFSGGKNGTYKEIIRYNGFSGQLAAIGIGKAIAAETGIKISNDVKKVVADDAYATLGYSALFSLQQSGFIESHTFKNEDNKPLELFKMTDKGREINKYSKLLGDYISHEAHPLPIVNPTEMTVDKTIRHSNVPLSVPMQNAVKAHQAKKYKLNKDMFNEVKKFVFVNGKLNDDRIAEFIGQPSSEEIANKHTTYRDDYASARQNAINEFKNSYFFFESLADGDVFSYEHFVSSSGRAMTKATGGGDFQNDKHFSRFVIDYIKPDGTTSYKVNSRNYNEFIFGILQGFDGVLDYVSKPEKTNFKHNKKLFTQIMKDFGKSSDKAIMEWATKNGVHAMRAARGFIQGRKHFNIDTGSMLKGSSFDSDLIFEVDGITNGLFHNILQSITSNMRTPQDAQEAIFSIFKRVGIYSQKGMNSQNLVKGTLDTYETVASKASELMSSKTGKSVEVFKMLYSEIKRSFAKSPTMIFNYGAGDVKIRRQVGEDVLEKLIEDLVDGKVSPQSFKGIKELSFADRVYKNPNSKALTDYEYSKASEFLSQGIGEAFSEAMSELFPSILSYNQNVYRIAASIRRLIANSDKFKKKLAELNSPDVTVGRYKELIKEIERMFPKYQSAWSMHGADSRNIQSHDLESKTTENQRRIKFNVGGKEISRSYKIKAIALKAGMKYSEDPAEYSAFKAGDKSRSVTATHNVDGATVNDPSIVDKYMAQVFDAIIGGVGMIDETTTGYNKAGYRINTQYSILESMLDSLKWMISDNTANENLYTKEYIDEAKQVIADMESVIAGNRELWESTISSIESIGQMSGYDGGQYDVEPELKSETINKFKNRTRKYGEGKVGSSGHFIPKHTIVSESELMHDEKAILDTFDSLGEYEKPENSSHLRMLVGSIVDKLGKPMTNVLQTMKISKNDVETIGNFNRDTASIHVSVSQNIKNRQYMTAQEVYSHELVHLASEYAFGNNPALFNQVRELMRKAKAKIDNMGGYEFFMDIMPDGRISAVLSEEEEIKAAKEKYEYIFSNPNEFFTYGLTNAAFSNALESMTDSKEQATNFFDRLLAILDIVMNFISTKLGTFVPTKGNYNEQLTRLSVDIFALNKASSKDSIYSTAQDIVEESMDKLDSKLEKSIDAMKSQFLSHSKPLAEAFRAIGDTVKFSVVKENRFVRNVFNEIVGGSDKVKPILKLMRTKEVYQKMYNDTRHEMSQHLKERLPATEKQEVAMQLTLIDTDIQSLGLSAKEVRELLASNTKLDEAIKSITKQIDDTAKTTAHKRYVNYVVNQSNSLGYFLAKGIVGVKRGQMLNAHNIVSAEYYNGTDIESSGVSVELVDKLATLYALKYSSSEAKATTASYIDSNKNGIDELMNLMREYNKKTASELFKGERHLIIKGFSQTIVDRDIEFEAVPYAKVKDAVNRGFKPVVDMRQSGKILMKRYNPDVKFTEGIMDTEQAGRKGTIDEMYNPFDEEGKYVPDDMSFLTNQRIGVINAIAGQNTLPLLNRKEVGVITGYRFVANKSLRMSHMNQEFRITKVLPDTFAMTMRKIYGMNNNKVLASQLVDMMKKDMSSNPENYIEILNEGATATFYRMIPEDMRAKLNHMLKGKSLFVHKDLLENVFGYKNMSVKNIDYIKSSDKVQRISRIGEKLVEDTVSHIRKNVVFKTKEVVIDNIISNFITLVWRGLNPITAIKYMDEGRMLMNQYRKDVSTIKRQEALRDSKSSLYDKVTHMEAIKAVQTKNGNPVVRLVKAGQFQSIIDDIDTELENNGNIVENFGTMLKERLPKHLQFIVDILYINENTRLYKFIMKMVQYSDFVARYAYYKYATKDKGMSSEAAIDEAEDMFVNYSLLQDRNLQYASDVGMFMFSKYFLRIQRMIARGFHKNAGRGIAQMVSQKATGDLSDISDSFIGTTNLFGRAGTDVSDVLSPHLPEWFL